MGYQHDIFISYRRDDLTRKWIERHFVPLLRHHIKMDLGRDPKIYIDTRLENGTSWPLALGEALGCSRTLIPLWTKTFLHSKWCSCEVGHMLEREKKTGFRVSGNPYGLIFPTVIHDGETMPVQLHTIQKLEIQDCYNVRMSVDSPKAEILDDKLRPLASDLTRSIEIAPEWKQDWQIEAENHFFQEYHKNEQSIQHATPRFTG